VEAAAARQFCAAVAAEGDPFHPRRGMGQEGTRTEGIRLVVRDDEVGE